MVIKTGSEYRESLRKRKPMNIYFMGKKIEDPLSHPLIKSAVNSIAMTYDLATQPEYSELMTAKSVSEITGSYDMGVECVMICVNDLPSLGMRSPRTSNSLHEEVT